MITAAQMRAARALLGNDQRALARLTGVSPPTIPRMKTSGGTVRGVVDRLTKSIDGPDRAGTILIGDNAPSTEGSRGIRLKDAQPPPGTG